MRVLALSASLQARSANLSFVQAVAASAPPAIEVVVFDGLRNLPLFNPDLEGDPPEPVLAWRRALAESDAVLIASPEYGFSLPGSLKNAIDWVIGSGELEGKIVAITAVVNHPDRGRRGLEALRGTLSAVSARILGGEPIVRGPTLGAEGASLLRAIADEFGRRVSDGG